MNFFKRIFSSEKKQTLDKGLEKTNTSFFEKLGRAIIGKSKVDDEVLDELEGVLVSSDVGVETTLKIIKRIEERVSKDKYLGTSELNKILREEIAGLLSETKTGEEEDFSIPKDKKPYVIMVVGVNGAGKTTTIGKLASQFKNKGYKVVLGAADTFRAAAIDQLQVWADRVGVPIVKQQIGSDPASVAFDTLSSAIASNLAKRYTLEESVKRAKCYISEALLAMLDLGKGSGPMNHAFNINGEYAKESENE